VIGSVITLIDQPEIQDQVQAVFDGTNYVLSWTDQRNYPYPAQSQDDIFAARVTTTGSALDPAGFAVANSTRPEYASTLGVLGDQVLLMYRSFRDESPFASYRLATQTLNDQSAPTLIGSPTFEFERDQAISFTFDRELSAVNPSDLIVENLTTGNTVPAKQFTVQTVPETNSWTYRWVYSGILPNGNYRATLPAGAVRSLNGVPTTADFSTDFFFVQGDANHDHAVNFDDYALIDNGFNNGLIGFSHGDFNYDGVINFDDYSLIDFAFNTQG
jgi:hypothetical protein